MLVRPVRIRPRGAILRAAGVLAIALGAARPDALIAQEQQPAAPTPKTHTVKRGDTLWDLAHSYLGDPFLWPEIYRLNTDVIEDPHWIYPGEVLKLPGAKEQVVAAAPTPQPVDTTSRIAKPVVTPAPADTAPAPIVQDRRTTVRTGEYIAAPWVDQQGGPKGYGYIVESAEIPGIASADRSRLQLHDRVFVATPSGEAASGRTLYLTYRLGPSFEDFGQIVIPTGIIEVARAPQPGEAAVGRVVKMFGEVMQGQRLIPLDSSAALAAGRPNPVTNGKTGRVRWILNEPVLPSLQSYVVLDLARGDGVATGDQIELYQPRQGPSDSRDIALPEISIGRAQVLRVTPYGATAIITAQDQPKIQEGTAVRVAAKMP